MKVSLAVQGPLQVSVCGTKGMLTPKSCATSVSLLVKSTVILVFAGRIIVMRSKARFCALTLSVTGPEGTRVGSGVGCGCGGAVGAGAAVATMSTVGEATIPVGSGLGWRVGETAGGVGEVAVEVGETSAFGESSSLLQPRSAAPMSAISPSLRNVLIGRGPGSPGPPGFWLG